MKNHRVILPILLGVFLSVPLSFFEGCKENTIQTVVLGPDDLTNPAIQPRIIFTLPASNTTGPFELYSAGENSGLPHFVVRFNKLMSLPSFDPKLIRVEGFDRPVRVILHPHYYPIIWLVKPIKLSKTSSADYDDILSFSILDSLSYSTPLYRIGGTYTVTVNPGLEDINGNKTSEQYRFIYTPEPYFRVTTIYPEDQSE